MTTLGSLTVPAGRANGKTGRQPLDFPELARDLAGLTASVFPHSWLGTIPAIAASLTAWTDQDDDAHEPCSLTACRHPLHPGPCKGWKGTLHSVAPGTYHQLEAERVRKANARRLQRIDNLRSLGKPIPRRLLEEIKPKPAPGHPAHGATPVPLGQVNQKADLAGGQAHAAGQAVFKAAGVTVKTAPLPLGPKQKKPTVAGRGPAFVITQPKVTDTYKLDKAAKITPQEWAGLTDADKTTIRNELTAIKARGFGPQQKKADELLLKLYAPNKPGTAPALKPGQAGTITTPSGKTYQKVSVTPGKISLGQASKVLGLPAPAPARPPAPRAPGPDVTDQVKKALDPTSRLSPAARTYVYRKLDKQQFDSFDDATKQKILADLDAQSTAASGPATLARDLKDRFAPGASGTPPTPARAAPASPPSAPPTPSVLSPDAQQARAVAGRAAPKAQMAKTHLDAYGKLSKADFDQLDAKTQKTIRDDLANAKAKFLDPKKQQVASDLLNRFGSKHTSPAPGAPAAPAHPKGYSDPVAQAVSAAHGVDDAEALKRIGQLSHPQIDTLDAADKRTITGRLAFIASHPKADPTVKEKAAAIGRALVGGKPSGMPKLDHEPTLNEIHAHAVKSGHAEKEAALKATEPSSMSGLPPAGRITALIALSKAQFDSLDAADQRKITDALQSLHIDRSDPYATKLDTAVGDALKIYTGQHPGVHRLKEAEADFRAGKISGDAVHTRFLTARVQALDKAGAAAVDAEAARIAKDNPTLPTYARVNLAGEKKYGTTTYEAAGLAGMKHNWEDAPRFSQSDFRDLFRPTEADLAAADPIHAQAVRDLQEHVLATGLDPASPWSTPTKGAAVDALLNTDSAGEIDRARLARYKELTPANQFAIRQVLRERLSGQTSSNAKTETWIAVRELEGRQPLTGAKRDAAAIAADRFAPSSAMDDLRKLDPQEFDEFPGYVQDALQGHLVKFQMRAEAAGPVRTWTSQDNALKVMPAALMAHLAGSRADYSDRRLRNASDIANYGQKIINPYDRSRVYRDIPVTRFRDMSAPDQAAIEADLGSISHDPGNSLAIRYGAQFTKDMHVNMSSPFNVNQLVAVGAVDPTFGNQQPDTNVLPALNNLSKADFDKLDTTFREAIDERIKALPGSDQQLLTAKFHPAAAAATPSGYTPTTVQATVPPHVQEALDTIYGTHPKSHTMAHQLKAYGSLRGSDFSQFNAQEQNHLLSDLSFIATTAKGPSADKAKKLIDRFTPAGTPSGQVPTPPVIPPANAVPGQVRYATPLTGTLVQAQDKGSGGDGWTTTPGGKRVWGKYGAAGLLLMHQDPATGEKRYLMVQRGPAISDPGKWQFPGGAIDSKETFHQGGTREVIEELGFKADALKDAQVHGEHTNAIPGSTWKYVSIAAQVPQMLKPDLSTHHARAETSDAKWMTEAEIKALDTSGKLLAPLAGGKLEQNVLSLFPQGPAPSTLGQIARPGPISKRLKRLTLPSGGRQVPASFNAWPHAHKPSKGKNLIPDKATFDAQRQKIKQDRKLYDGKTADGRLAAIGAQQGFDDTPTVLDKKEIDRLLATGDYIEAWRGVSGAGGHNWRSGRSSGKTAAQINEEMRSGPAYYGKGIFGNGYYLATQRRVATQYADSTNGSIARILIPKSALTKKYDEISKESHANPRQSKAKGSNYEESTFYDPGRYAAAKGLDGIEIETHHVSPGGGARHVAQPGKPAFNWLNRSVLIIQKEPG